MAEMEGKTVLKEFLVSLGFRLDTKTFLGFTQGLTGATAMVAKFGGAAIGAAQAAFDFTTKVSANLEQLGFVSQNIGSSIGALKDYQRAMESIGLSGDAATSQLQQFAAQAQIIQKGQLQTLGIPYTGDTVQEFRNVIRLIHNEKNDALALAYGARFNFSPGDVRTLRARDLPSNRVFGDDMKGMADSAHAFQNDLRLIGADFDKISYGIENYMVPALDALLKIVDAFANPKPAGTSPQGRAYGQMWSGVGDWMARQTQGLSWDGRPLSWNGPGGAAPRAGGLGATQIAAMFGNVMQESSGHVDASVIDRNGLRSMGLFQMQGGIAAAFRKMYGKNPDQASAGQQWAFVKQMIAHDSGLRAALQAWGFWGGDTKQATLAFYEAFEQGRRLTGPRRWAAPGADANMGRRYSEAQGHVTVIINAPNGDAKAIADHTVKGIKDAQARLARGMRSNAR